MKELALVTLLTQAPQPMFTDGGQAFAFTWVCRQRLGGLEVLGRRRCMSQGTVERSERAARCCEVESAYLVVCKHIKSLEIDSA